MQRRIALPERRVMYPLPSNHRRSRIEGTEALGLLFLAIFFGLGFMKLVSATLGATPARAAAQVTSAAGAAPQGSE